MSPELNDGIVKIRPSRSIRRWLIAGIAVSSAVLVVISLSTGVTLSQLTAIGYGPLGLAAITVLVKLVLQVFKFRVLADGLSGPRIDLAGLGRTRIGSEFVALATPSMIGGEFVRAAWLTRKGMDTGRALWIGYVEVCIDVYVGCTISLVAALYVLLRGAILLSSIIFAAILPIVAGYTIFLLLSIHRGISFPKSIFDFAGRFIGEERARDFEARVKKAADAFGEAAKMTMRKDSLLTVTKATLLGSLQALFSGITLWVILNPEGLRIDPISSMLAVFGVQAIASIPITVGGSGTSELGLFWYLSTVYGFSSWATIVLWRLLSYQFALIITGVAFILFLNSIMNTGGSGSRLNGRPSVW